MRKTAVRQPRTVGGLLMKLLIAILSVFLAVGIMALVSIVHDDFSYRKVEEDDFFYAVEYGNYTNLVSLKHRPMSEKTTQKVKGCIAVGDYFEAASMRRAYLDCGKLPEAQAEQEKMDSLRQTLAENSLSFAADDIDNKLGDRPTGKGKSNE